MIGLGNYVLSGGEDPDDPPPMIFGRARSLGMKINWKRSGNYIATPGMGEVNTLTMPEWLSPGALVSIGIAAWLLWPKKRKTLRRNPNWGEPGGGGAPPGVRFSMEKTIAAAMNKTQRKKFGKIFWAAKRKGARSSTAYDIALRRTMGDRFMW